MKAVALLNPWPQPGVITVAAEIDLPLGYLPELLYGALRGFVDAHGRAGARGVS
ncbi:MAG TPA: hypothetical protein VF282_08165 [Bacillota bacterium]